MTLPKYLEILTTSIRGAGLASGVALLFGVFTRLMGGISAGLMVVFLIAMIQAAARGLDPNCGCFSGPTGNPLGLQIVKMLGPIGSFLANERVGVVSITRDIVLLLMGLHLMRVPTIWSFDSWRAARAEATATTFPEAEDDPDAADDAEPDEDEPGAR